MTSLQLIDNNFIHIKLEESVERALDLMWQFGCNHLPVVESETGQYKGLLNKKDISDSDDKSVSVATFSDVFKPAFVNGSSHFLKVIPIVNLYRTDVIPVVNDSYEYLGSITHIDLLNAIGNFSGAGDHGALIVLEIEKSKLRFSELNSIVESDGATLMHFNVTPVGSSQNMEVTLGIDNKEISAIVATLNRYNYKVLFTSGEDLLESELSENYDNLMNYLHI